MCSSPVRHWLPYGSPFDLHVLGTPPAFILSQDQTLHLFFGEKPLSALFFISFLSDAFLLSFQCSVSTHSLECFINIPLPRCFVNTFFLKLKNSYFSFLLFHLLKLFHFINTH